MTPTASTGYFVDHLYVFGGLLSYPVDSLLPVPPWMALLWMNFALILDTGLAGLKKRPLLAAVLGAIGGPLAYSAGVGFGLIELHAAPFVAYAAIAVTWALGLPALLASTRYWGVPELPARRTAD